MSEASSLSELVTEAKAIADRCLSTDSADDCDALDQLIHDIDEVARETIQARLTDDLLRIAAKLEAGGRPTEDEERLIETVAIGAASRYVSVENNVPDWKAELTRLLDRLGASTHDAADVDALLRVRGLCRDAAGVLPDLRHWMVESERIQRFREAAARDDPDRGAVLAGYIRGVLASRRR